MKALAAALVAVLALLGPPTLGLAAPTVDVLIEVLEAKRREPGFAGTARRYQKQLESMGFVGARAIDTLTAEDRSVGSTVELRFKGPGGTERAIRVTVLESTASATKLHIGVPAYKFDTSTTHRDGGTVLMIVPKDDLVLAVQPR